MPWTDFGAPQRVSDHPLGNGAGIASFCRDGTILQPGLDRMRKELCLALRRESTQEEDKPYSLFGILRVMIPVIQREGARAVGRLLEHVLLGSGDVTILACTGTANDYNSCQPKDLIVYNEVVPSHIPPLMEVAEVDQTLTELRPLPDLSLSTTL